MKLNSLVEQNNFLYDEESVSEYLKSFGYEVGNNNENFSIKNGVVNLDKDVEFSGFGKELKIKLGFVCDIKLARLRLPSLKGFLPITSQQLSIVNCEVSNVLDITTYSPTRYIDIVRCNNLSEIRTISPSIFINECDNLSSLTFNSASQEDKTIILSECKNIKSFASIKTKNKLHRLVLKECGILSYKDFDINVDSLVLSCVNTNIIKDFSFIENVQPNKKIALSVFENHTAYIINVLLVKTDKIFLNFVKFKKDDLELIMEEFIIKDKNEREEHIMDCAIKLLDAGFEKEAQL